MLKHCVFANIKCDVPAEDIERVLSGFGHLVDQIPGMIDYSHGPNLDFENKSADYDHGFVITFTDGAALAAYDTLPTHRRLGAELVSFSEGGGTGIMVFDLSVTTAEPG